MRNCPQCHLMLESAEVDGTVVETCRGCGGSWFTWEALADALANHPSVFGSLRERYPSASSPEAFAGIPQPCPECKVVALSPAAAPGDPTFTLPRCPRCGGVWVDSAARDLPAAPGPGPLESTAPAPNGGGIAAGLPLPQPLATESAETWQAESLENPVTVGEVVGGAPESNSLDVLAANQEFAGRYDGSRLRRDPARHMAILTCMDVRIPVEAMLGLRPGDAHVIRNAGAVVTEDVLRSLLVSIHLLGTREVLVIAHTDCGQTAYLDDEMKGVLARKMGTATVSPACFHTFADPATSVGQQMERIASHPWIPEYVKVRGFVFDVRTGRLSEVKWAEKLAGSAAG